MHNPCFCFSDRSRNIIYAIDGLTPFEQTELMHEVEQKSFSTWDDCYDYISQRAIQITSDINIMDSIDEA